MTQQSGREFPPAIATKRASHVPLPPNAKPEKIRVRPHLDPQPLQPRAPLLLTPQFQAQPHRRPLRVASTWPGIRGSFTGRVETSSHLSDSTYLIHFGGVRVSRAELLAPILAAAKNQRVVRIRLTAPIKSEPLHLNAIRVTAMNKNLVIISLTFAG